MCFHKWFHILVSWPSTCRCICFSQVCFPVTVEVICWSKSSRSALIKENRNETENRCCDGRRQPIGGENMTFPEVSLLFEHVCLKHFIPWIQECRSHSKKKDSEEFALKSITSWFVLKDHKRVVSLNALFSFWVWISAEIRDGGSLPADGLTGCCSTCVPRLGSSRFSVSYLMGSWRISAGGWRACTLCSSVKLVSWRFSYSTGCMWGWAW